MVTVVIPCPYRDGVDMEVELTFEGDPPFFSLDAPQVVAHMRAEHGGR